MLAIKRPLTGCHQPQTDTGDCMASSTNEVFKAFSKILSGDFSGDTIASTGK